MIEDELHFILYCPLYKELRTQYIPEYYWLYPSENQFNMLMYHTNVDIIRNLSMYIHHAFKKRDDYMFIYE